MSKTKSNIFSIKAVFEGNIISEFMPKEENEIFYYEGEINIAFEDEDGEQVLTPAIIRVSSKAWERFLKKIDKEDKSPFDIKIKLTASAITILQDKNTIMFYADKISEKKPPKEKSKKTESGENGDVMNEDEEYADDNNGQPTQMNSEFSRLQGVQMVESNVIALTNEILGNSNVRFDKPIAEYLNCSETEIATVSFDTEMGLFKILENEAYVVAMKILGQEGMKVRII